MRTSILMVVVAAAAVATLVFAQSSANDYIWRIVDSTTEDTGMSNPSPGREPVPCNRDLRGIGAKCSDESEYKAVPRGGNFTLACASDTSLDFAFLSDTDVQGSVSWTCDKTKNWQQATITGQLSRCRDVHLTAASICIRPTEN